LIEAVAITEGPNSEYYEGMVRIPILGLPYGDYLLTRYNPSDSTSEEIIQAVTLVQIGGLADIGANGGGGNSGTELRFNNDDFFDDIGENCFKIVKDFITVDFTDPI
jgi:hypothetical protein